MSQSTNFGTSLFSLQNLHKILLHVDVDRAVAGEGAAAFDMAGEGRDEVRGLIRSAPVPTKKVQPMAELFVRAKGLEPIHTKALDPKSSLSTNFNTPATFRNAKIRLFFHSPNLRCHSPFFLNLMQHQLSMVSWLTYSRPFPAAVPMSIGMSSR